MEILDEFLLYGKMQYSLTELGEILQDPWRISISIRPQLVSPAKVLNFHHQKQPLEV